jgi:2-desacetyl-2-hydroxyethyl bacteriochlorophyllide A dehydrogenase
MKAIVVSEPFHFELTNLPTPDCGPDQVVIRTNSCGICGTDLEILRGSLPAAFTRYPLVPGHEWTGVVEETGKNVKTLQPGDRVSVEGYLDCGVCAHCRAGEKNLCATHEQLGLTHNGGFAEYVAAPARSCHLVADHITLEEAVMVEPAATVVRSIERASIKKGVKAAIIGCGPIGQLAARVLGMYSPAAILGVDLSEAQRPMAKRAGMTQFTTNLNPEELRQMSGGEGWDLVVNCGSGSKAVELTFALARRGATVILIGGAPDSQMLSIPANRISMGDMEVVGVCGYSTESWTRTLQLLERGELEFNDLITHRVPLDEFARAIQLVGSKSEPMGKVMITYQ